MTSKQNKPQGLTVSTNRQSALVAAISPLDSILPVKKRSLRTHTLSDVTPHTPDPETLEALGKSSRKNSRKPKTNTKKSSNKKTKKSKKKSSSRKNKKQSKKAAALDDSIDSLPQHDELENDRPGVPAAAMASTTTDSKKKSGDVFQQYYTHTETWKIVEEKKNVFDNKMGTPSQNIYTMVKNSKQDPSEKIDEKLYSSLKYVLLHKVNPAYFTDDNGDLGFILCRVQVVCPDTGEEIRRDGEGILGGSIESSLRMDAVTSMKIQFTSCSSHHDKKQFAFRLQYFLNSNLKEPILVKQSTPFLVYARKKTGSKRKKRSKNGKESKQAKASSVDGDLDIDMDEETIHEPKLKRRRTLKPLTPEDPDDYQYPQNSTTFNLLAREVDRLKKELFDALPGTEKSQAKTLIVEKLSINLPSSVGHVASALSGHSHFPANSGIPQTIGTINTPATPSGLFASNTGTLLTPLQTPNPDAPNGSGVPQPMSLAQSHDEHFKHQDESIEDHEHVTASHHHHHSHHPHHHHSHVQHGTDEPLTAQTPNDANGDEHLESIYGYRPVDIDVSMAFNY